MVQLQTKTPPWRAICSLEIATPNGLFRGTGWLAGPRLVMTAAHCVYRPREFGGWAREIIVSPGRTWRSQPFGSFVSQRFSCAAEWIRTGRRETDLGCIHLAEPVGESLGWFRYAGADPGALVGASVVASGYPEFSGTYNNLLTASGAVHDTAPGRIFYDVDTTDGQSGAPVWSLDDDPANPTVFAVHTYEPDPGRPGQFNSATLLTAEALGLIAEWQNLQ
ncbi:MAG TPA: trypsin-like peptidase domain-containing protein [Allosphingosinicella sp.]